MEENGKHKEDDFRSIEDKVNKLMSEAKEKGRKLLREGLETAKQAFDQKATAVREKASELNGKTVEEIAEDAKLYVRLHPLKSLAMAAGLGFLVGYFARNKE